MISFYCITGKKYSASLRQYQDFSPDSPMFLLLSNLHLNLFFCRAQNDGIPG